MATKVFISLPVKDLEKSVTFFTGLGFSFNSQFTDENSTSMIVSDSIYVLLQVESYFQSFTQKQVSDAHKSTEVLIALDAASRAEVRHIIAKAKSLGAEIYAEPQDYGWMYQHCFADPDGHQWEFVYMDNTQLPNQ